MIVSINAQLPHLATKAEVAKLPTRGYLWGVLAAMVADYTAALGCGRGAAGASPMAVNAAVTPPRYEYVLMHRRRKMPVAHGQLPPPMPPRPETGPPQPAGPH